MKKINLKNLELLAPAGSPEKMKYALHYGADAVYAGIPNFSLRARINAFDMKSLKEGVDYAHNIDKKFYVTLNIYAHNQHFKALEGHLKALQNIDMDGIILSDPGILTLVKKYLPEAEIHLSTQANATNWRSVKFWADQGVKRIVLAREVTLTEIKEIHKRVPEVELEYFVHGAMCMSYSGRCMLSKWMSGRSANLGDCSQPCRWSYKKISHGGKIKNLNVIDRQGEFELDLEEDDQGTYFFNSKDLNLLSYLNDLIEAGVTSFKIEGRNKSVYYLATVIRAYRNTLDNLAQGKDVSKYEQKNLDNLVHRGYTAGFLLGNEPEHNFENSHSEPARSAAALRKKNSIKKDPMIKKLSTERSAITSEAGGSKYEFVGEVIEVKSEKLKVKSDRLAKVYPIKSGKSGAEQFIRVKVHNAIYKDDELEIIDKNGNFSVKIVEMCNEKMEGIESAHGGHKEVYYFKFDKENIEPMSLIRKKVK